MGGQALRGTFRKKRASKNFFPEMLSTGGGRGVGGHLKKIFRTYQKNFPDISHFFLNNYEKNFPDIPKNFPDIWYFSRKRKKFSGNSIVASFQKCPLGKKCNLNDIFHARKGHFAPGKRALGKTWGAWPPGPYAPACKPHWRLITTEQYKPGHYF